MIQRFEVELLEEAFKFLEKVDLKPRRKIFQNMNRSQYYTDPKLFRNWKVKFGNLEPCPQE